MAGDARWCASPLAPGGFFFHCHTHSLLIFSYLKCNHTQSLMLTTLGRERTCTRGARGSLLRREMASEPPTPAHRHIWYTHFHIHIHTRPGKYLSLLLCTRARLARPFAQTAHTKGGCIFPHARARNHHSHIHHKRAPVAHTVHTFKYIWSIHPRCVAPATALVYTVHSGGAAHRN